MDDSRINRLWSSVRTRATLLFIIGAGAVSRFINLTSDPPDFLKNTSRAILTDPYNLTYFARNKVLFGSWDIFDYNRWIAFKYSLASLVSYIWFAAFGVSQLTANLSALTLSLGGIILFCLVIFKRDRSAALIAGVILFSTMVLNLYGRYPFLENGLIFLCAVLFWIYIRFREKIWGLALCGLLTALCILSGKLFGLVMAVPVIVVLIVHDRKEWTKRTVIYGIALIGSIALLAILFYGSDIGTVFNYISEQTTGMYGPPEALKSPKLFVEQMMTLGGSSLTFNYAPFLAILLMLTTVYLFLRPDVKKLLTENTELLFLFSWLIAGSLLLSFPNYRPLRYQLFLFPPLAGVIGLVLTGDIDRSYKGSPGWIRKIILLVAVWFFSEQLVMAAIRPFEFNMVGLAYRMVWYFFPVALALTGALLYMKRHFINIMSRSNLLLMILLGIFVIYQYQWIYRWHSENSHIISNFAEDTKQALGENAVIIGPFANTLTINNDIKSFIYMFGLTKREPNLFTRFPITHLVVDRPNWNMALKDYPELKGSLELFNGTLKYTFVNVVKVPDSILKISGADYVDSDYELALENFTAGRNNEAENYLKRFLDKYPRNSHGVLLAAKYYFGTGNFGKCLEVLEPALERSRNDFSFIFEVGSIYYQVALVTGNTELTGRADEFFNRSIELNPEIAPQVDNIKAKIRSIFEK